MAERNDPIRDYVIEWLDIYRKVSQIAGPQLSEAALIRITRDIIGPFSPYWLERNLEYYGFKTENEFMQRHLVDTLENFVESLEKSYEEEFEQANNLIQSSAGIPIHAENGDLFIVVQKDGTYEYRRDLYNLGLRWNPNERHWEATLPLDKVREIQNFCRQKNLTFEVG